MEWRTMEPIKWEPKQRRTDEMLVPPNTQRQAAKAPKKNDRVGSLSSDNSNITSIPKKPKSSKVPQSLVDSDFGYVSQQSLDEQDISSSISGDKHQKPLRTNPGKPRAEITPKMSLADTKEKYHPKLVKKSRKELETISAAALPGLLVEGGQGCRGDLPQLEESVMLVSRPRTQKSITDTEEFDNMEETYMLEEATRPILTGLSWNWMDLVAASKSMKSPKIRFR